MGELAGGFEYPAVNAAIAGFEKPLKIDRELQQKIKPHILYKENLSRYEILAHT
jgi:hypothetical protein